MNALRWLVPVLLLPACAAPPLTSTLGAGAGAARAPAQPVVALESAQAPAAAAALRARLSDALRGLEAPAASVTVRGEAVTVRVGAAAAFAPGTAQFRGAVLEIFARAGEVLARTPHAVVHAVVSGPGDGSGDPLTHLTARRAASLHEFLAGQGLPAPRLRSEGRQGPGRAETVDIVVQPVVRGREAAAWVPPPDS